MTLQDDIARYANVRGEGWPVVPSCAERIAAGLEREKIIIDRDELPEEVCRPEPNGSVFVDGMAVMADVDHLRGAVYRNLAAIEFLQSRESEAAARQARRDELAARFAGGLESYDRLLEGERALIDDLIAAEAEVARLKGEGR